MSQGKRFRYELKGWILDQIILEKYNTINDACDKIAKDILKLNCGKTVKNYLYGQREPVSAKHCPKLSKATGIPLHIMNWEVWSEED